MKNKKLNGLKTCQRASDQQALQKKDVSLKGQEGGYNDEESQIKIKQAQYCWSC